MLGWIMETNTDDSLSQFIFDLQEDQAAGEEDVHREMERLAEKYGTIPSRPTSRSSVEKKRDGGKTIVSRSRLTKWTQSLKAALDRRYGLFRRVHPFQVIRPPF